MTVGDKVGAFQSFERGREAAVSLRLPLDGRVAASKGKGRLYADLYSVAQPASSSGRLRSGAPRTWPGSRSRSAISRAATTPRSRRSSSIMPAERINLSFADGMLFARLDNLSKAVRPPRRCSTAPTLAEQLGFRKIIDTTFMITHDVHGQPVPEDLRKFFAALRRAQRDIDLRPDLYTQYYRNESPARYHADGHTALAARRAPGVRALHQDGL